VTKDTPGTTPGSVEPAAKPADLDGRRKALGTSLEGARRRHDPLPDQSARGSALGMAFKVATEFLAGLLVGGAIGWFLDDWLGTKPVLFLLFFVLGAAAGIMNVFRQAYRMNREMQAGGETGSAAGNAGAGTNEPATPAEADERERTRGG
jgi:ATP synthase protein I